MIAIDLVQSTAETLMKKAAIEIPDDYLTGLKAAAAEEDGDLSSFVLDAMLENYEAAREDSRAMCGDTGCPRWYVKMGNKARIDGGLLHLRRRCGGPPLPPRQRCHCVQTACILYGGQIMTIMSVLAHQKLNMVLNRGVTGLI